MCRWCLPQEIISQLPRHIKVVDLSADFRLRNVDTYAEWCAATGSCGNLDLHISQKRS